MSVRQSDEQPGHAAAPLEPVRDEDQPAFEAIFRCHYQRVYGLLYRLVGDDAEDLVQETFLRLYTRPPTTLATDVGAWLYRVATNLGYNALRAERRARARRELLGRLTGGLGWQTPEADPEQCAEHDAAQHQVRQALARLSERDAGLLILRYSGLSYADLAQTLGLAPGSIGTLLARAERAFQRAYRP